LKRVLAIVAALVVLGGGGLITQLEEGPSYEPWIEPLPEYAVEEGYWDFRATEGGYAVPWWPDLWMGWDGPRGDGPLLIDRRHATKQLETETLGLEDYRYDDMHGLYRAFEPARQAGVRLKPVWEPWTPGTLGGASAVFINLVSGDNPGFLHSEVLALESFVRHGGGLVIIVDHTNCYFHAEMLQELSDALGFDILPRTAADKSDGNRLSPRSVAWIRVRDSGVEHPVTRDVRVAGWMNGGIVVPQADSELVGLMQNSAEGGWADVFMPFKKDDSAGFTGNLKFDEDEVPGPHQVVLAGRHGQGRVVVLADQNAFGATVIGYEDNAQLFANALGWAVGQDVGFEARGPSSVTTIGGDRSLCTAAADYAFRTFQVQSQRMGEDLAVPEFCTQDGEVHSDGIVLLPEARRADLAELLQAERVLGIVDPQFYGSRRLLEQLDLIWGEHGEPAEGLVWPGRPVVDHRLFDEVPDIEPLSVRPLEVFGDYEVLAEDGAGRPVLIKKRNAVLLLDATLVQNGTLGGERDKPWKEDEPPAKAAGHRLALSLLATVYPPR